MTSKKKLDLTVQYSTDGWTKKKQGDYNTKYNIAYSTI